MMLAKRIEKGGCNIPRHGRGAQSIATSPGRRVRYLNWYFAYNLFLLAGITKGIAGRSANGTAAARNAMESASAPFRWLRRHGSMRRRRGGGSDTQCGHKKRSSWRGLTRVSINFTRSYENDVI